MSGCRGTLRFEEEHGGAFPMSLYWAYISQTGLCRACNRQREKELLEDLFHPKPRDQKTCDLTLEIFQAKSESQTPRGKPHFACLQSCHGVGSTGAYRCWVGPGLGTNEPIWQLPGAFLWSNVPQYYCHWLSVPLG